LTTTSEIQKFASFTIVLIAPSTEFLYLHKYHKSILTTTSEIQKFASFTIVLIAPSTEIDSQIIHDYGCTLEVFFSKLNNTGYIVNQLFAISISLFSSYEIGP